MNPGTIVKAYQELEHEGIIYTQHGKGVFMARTNTKRLSRKERETSVKEAASLLYLQGKRMNLSHEEFMRITQKEFKHQREQ